MLFSFTSRIVSALAAFLYPGYASYKTLSQRPASEAELERWLMYWSVLGCIVGVEYLAEWMVSWIPLYTTFKAIFLLYLALPQTQGSTYIYMVHLRPFFATHEKQIDVAIAEIRSRAYRFIQEKARALWAALISALAPGATDPNAQQYQNQPAVPTGQPPAAQPTGPTQLLSSLWTSYGPGIIAGGAAFLRQTAAATLPGQGTPAPAESRALNTPPGSSFFNPGVDPVARRKQLEAELASLPPYPPSASSVPIPPADNPARPNISPSSSSSSGSGLRERTLSSGKFEEIKGNDVEGYEVDEDFVGGFVASGPSGTTIQAKRSTSWFSGWGSSSGKDDRGAYERVKSE